MYSAVIVLHSCTYMIKLTLLSLFFLLASWSALAKPSGKKKSASTGYKISVSLKPYKNKFITLAHYFGDDIVIDDRVKVNADGMAVFKGTRPLPGGIYLVYYPQQLSSFEILVDKQQHFSVSIQPGSGKVQFFNSPENDLLLQYQNFSEVKNKEIEAAQQRLSNAETAKDSSTCIHALSEIDKAIQQYRKSLIRQHKGTFLSTLLIELSEPVLPVNLKKPGTSFDLANARYFTKAHYWDGVNFWDGRLAYTPFFGSKLDKYFTEIVDIQTDSVIKELNWMLAYANSNEIMTHFLLNKFIRNSTSHYYKWDDAVFVHLFEKFIAPKAYAWVSAEERTAINERAYKLMGTIAGIPAPDINLPGTSGKLLSLYSLSTTYTLVCFWDVTCSHCRTVLPVIDSLYRTGWKQIGVKIFAVSGQSDGSKEDWLHFISENHLEEWSNVYNSKEKDIEQINADVQTYAQLYDVWFTPTFFLVDKEKKFIAKKLTYKQMNELMKTLVNQ